MVWFKNHRIEISSNQLFHIEMSIYERLLYSYQLSCFSPFIFQIKNLKETEVYVFRVRAQNKAGVGKTSDVTDPVTAQTRPGRNTVSFHLQSWATREVMSPLSLWLNLLWVSGTKEIVVDVDDDGIISLNFECCDMTADSKFVWSKNYEEMTEEHARLSFETKGNKWGLAEAWSSLCILSHSS